MCCVARGCSSPGSPSGSASPPFFTCFCAPAEQPRSALPPAPPRRDDSCPAPGGNTPCRFYVAEAGDSLAVISTAFSLDLAQMVALNNNTDGNLILQPGQKVLLLPFPENCGAGAWCARAHPCVLLTVVVVGGDKPAPLSAWICLLWGAPYSCPCSHVSWRWPAPRLQACK